MLGDKKPAPTTITWTVAALPRRTQVLLMVLAATAIGAGAAWLSHAGGNNMPTAILTAGGAFGGAMGVLLAVAHYAGGA